MLAAEMLLVVPTTKMSSGRAAYWDIIPRARGLPGLCGGICLSALWKDQGEVSQSNIAGGSSHRARSPLERSKMKRLLGTF